VAEKATIKIDLSVEIPRFAFFVRFAFFIFFSLKLCSQIWQFAAFVPTNCKNNHPSQMFICWKKQSLFLIGIKMSLGSEEGETKLGLGCGFMHSLIFGDYKCAFKFAHFVESMPRH
jgi:hypothetical protein